MKKILPQTKNITDENVENIAQLLPQVITETKDDEGNVKKVVDFELLKQHLSDNLVDGSDERYRLDWPGKRASILKANTPINKTLRPDRESSVNFDETENVYIEGDNFEVLKVLQESYLGKIKMIYIDPPYNTGKDFVYTDKFTKSKDEYEDEIGAEDAEGGKLFKNTDTNGRFHSDWLSMMYERLIVARDLLTDDGVIFMSIDDNEVHNLRKIADEVFGEENFVAQIIWQNKEGGGGSDSRLFKIKHEYCIAFSKKKDITKILGEDITNEDRYTESDKWESTRGKYLLIRLESGSLGYIESLDYPIESEDGTIILPNKNGEKIKRWRWSKKKVEWGKKNDYIVFKKGGDGEMAVYTKQYLNADNEGNIISRSKNPLAVVDDFSTTQSAKKLAKLFEGKIFDYPKPISYLKWLISRVENDTNTIILDFFSGSASTAHATMQLNAEDGGNRKFIMVQLPEETDEKSEAFKAGYKTISEIGMERIRRAGNKIIDEHSEKLAERETSLDTGFRVYKTDSSNIKDVYYNPAELKQENLLDAVDNIKDDRTSEDLLTQVILDLGLTLDLPMETKDIGGVEVFYVAGNSLVACFDADISDSVLKTIAESEPIRVVFRDSSFKQTEDKINVETIFKSVSPDTKIIVL